MQHPHRSVSASTTLAKYCPAHQPHTSPLHLHLAPLLTLSLLLLAPLLQDGSASAASSGPRALSGILPQEDTIHHERGVPGSPGPLDPGMSAADSERPHACMCSPGCAVLLLHDCISLCVGCSAAPGLSLLPA